MSADNIRSANVRELEREWLDSKGGRDGMPQAVRATWFLSSVIVRWRDRRKGWGTAAILKQATSDQGTVDDVREALMCLTSIGDTAASVLHDIDTQAAES
jgi:hypothetical protein